MDFKPVKGFSLEILTHKLSPNDEENFKCVKCKLLLRDPVQASRCGHRYCRCCFLALFKASSPQCPKCLEEGEDGTVHLENYPDKSVWMSMKKIMVRCPSKSCRFIGSLIDYMEHEPTCFFCTREEVLCCAVEEVSITTNSYNGGAMAAPLSQEFEERLERLSIASYLSLEMIEELKRYLKDVKEWHANVGENYLPRLRPDPTQDLLAFIKCGRDRFEVLINCFNMVTYDTNKKGLHAIDQERRKMKGKELLIEQHGWCIDDRDVAKIFGKSPKLDDALKLVESVKECRDKFPVSSPEVLRDPSLRPAFSAPEYDPARIMHLVEKMFHLVREYFILRRLLVGRKNQPDLLNCICKGCASELGKEENEGSEQKNETQELKDNSDHEWQTQTKRKNREAEERMPVPWYAVSKILGTGRSTLKEIESQTNTKIDFKQEQEVIFRGTRDAIKKAKKRVEEIIKISQRPRKTKAEGHS